MARFDWNQYDVQFLANLALPVRNLEATIKQNRGARIGQTTIASQKVHTFNPLTPQIINILQNADAGQAFYQRQECGSVYHLDIFHQCGLVDHRQVAASIKKAVDTYNFHYSVNNLVFLFPESSCEGVKADFIDIQTGTGGGRITGALNFGKKLSLRRAHENHVHIAIMMAPYHLAFLFYVVLAVESVILDHNLELRCNEKIMHVNSKEKTKQDLSAYTDQTDSFLQPKSAAPDMSPNLKRHNFIRDALELADDFDTIQDVKDFLQQLDNNNKNKLLKELEQNGNNKQALDRLVGMGIIDMDNKSVKLTNYGADFKRYLDGHLLDIEAHLRQSLRMVKPLTRQAGRSKFTEWVASWDSSGICKLPETSNCDQSGELAVSETVNAAARRMVAENRSVLQIDCSDLRHFKREKKQRSEICLLIDASASMAGQRIRAAKFLVRHLLLTTPDRIGVVTFQDNQANVQVPLTRDYGEIEQSLRKIRVSGATPLALGLKTCLEYLVQAKARNPLIILITDGIPTFAEHSRDPMADALVAAKDISIQGYGFTCIGLKPQRNYLAHLAQCAGGTIYVLEELEKQVLVEAAWEQCVKRCL